MSSAYLEWLSIESIHIDISEIPWRDLSPDEYFDICLRAITSGADTAARMRPCQLSYKNNDPSWLALKTSWVKSRSMYKILTVDVCNYSFGINTYSNYVANGWISMDEYYDLAVAAIRLTPETVECYNPMIYSNEHDTEPIEYDHLSIEHEPIEFTFSDEQNYQLALLAIEKNPRLISRAKRGLSPERWMDLCRIAVSVNGVAIKHIPNPPLDLQFAAVSNTPLALMCIPDPEEIIARQAVSLCGLAICSLNEPSPLICIEAFNQNPRIYNHIIDDNNRALVLRNNIVPKLACLPISTLLRTEIAEIYERRLMYAAMARPREKWLTTNCGSSRR